MLRKDDVAFVLKLAIIAAFLGGVVVYVGFVIGVAWRVAHLAGG